MSWFPILVAQNAIFRHARDPNFQKFLSRRKTWWRLEEIQYVTKSFHWTNKQCPAFSVQKVGKYVWEMFIKVVPTWRIRRNAWKLASCDCLHVSLSQFKNGNFQAILRIRVKKLAWCLEPVKFYQPLWSKTQHCDTRRRKVTTFFSDCCSLIQVVQYHDTFKKLDL